jgi:2-polyprenyl-3-methyl-5-hydroxy-6-metoxy-1,4-benzoquinol methylase
MTPRERSFILGHRQGGIRFRNVHVPAAHAITLSSQCCRTRRSDVPRDVLARDSSDFGSKSKMSRVSKNMPQIEEFFRVVINLRLYSRRTNLLNHLTYFFRETELTNKSVLDVGGGSGLLSFWVAVNGGTAVCLEPEVEGSYSGMQDNFLKLANALRTTPDQVLQIPSTFQEFSTDAKFDVITLANSINHLNEEATINLRDDSKAIAEYRSYFQKMFDLLKNDGKVIITDCDRYNFFNALGLRSPFMPAIAWHKHQPPFVWAKLLKETGFKEVSISWTSPNGLGSLGRVLLGNRLVAYFLLSHFRIQAMKRCTSDSEHR